MTNINLPVAMENLETIFKLQKEGKFNFVPILKGTPGIGKTSFIKDLAKKLDYELYSVSGAKPMEFFSGLPITDRAIAEDGEVGRAIWTQPELIGHSNILNNKTKKPVLLFIDDIHLIGEASDYLFELLLEKSLNAHKLNQEVYILGASNTSSLSGYNGFPAAIVNRMMLMPVYLSFDTWYKNIGIGLNSYITTFMRTNSEFINEKENTESPFGSFRSWTEYCVAFQEVINGKSDEEVLELVEIWAQSFVSESAVTSLKTSIITQQKFNFKTLLAKTKIPLPKKGTVEQIIYSSIIKFCKTELHFKKILKLILDASNDKNSTYSTFLLNVILDLVSLKEYLEIKEPKSDKINFIEEILAELTLIPELEEIILKYL
jgi:hypothetical protein